VDDIRQLADLKQQISQNVTVLRSNSIFCDFVICELADIVLKRRCKLQIFVIIFAVFLHDLSFAYQISSKRNLTANL